MHRLPQHDINGDNDDDDVHNARMANGALPRIRKSRMMLVVWFCCRLKK